jgi:hypothetical protein
MENFCPGLAGMILNLSILYLFIIIYYLENRKLHLINHMKIHLNVTFKELFCLCLLFNAAQVFGQQITPQVIPLGKPKIINFKALADYQLTHPIAQKQCIVEQGEDREPNYKFKPQQVPDNAPVFAVPVQERSVNSISPAPRTVFNAITSNGSYFPPDINGAVGNTYIVETTNQQFNIYTKTGSFQSELEISNFFAQDTSFFNFDPHVEYDAAHQRYIAIIDGQNTVDTNSDVFVAVSLTDDPTGDWYIYSFLVANWNPVYLLDYPLLGYNENWVVITGNAYTTNGDEYAAVYVLNRAELYKGTLNIVKAFSDRTHVSVTPTQTYDTTVADDYIVQDANGDAGTRGFVEIGSVSGSVGSPSYSDGPNLGVPSPWSDDGSIGATQKGTSQNIESGLDTKIMNSVYKNGSLWFTHTVYLPAASPTHCAVDWWQVAPTTPPSVTQFDRIEDSSGIIDYYYPSISVDAASDVLIGYCTSSPYIYAGSQYSYHASNDAANTTETGYLFKDGEAPYKFLDENGRNRYGDFTFTTIDPVDNSFWTFQEYASTSYWGTVAANIVGGPSAVNTLTANNTSIEVYPNPTTGRFNITMHNLPAGSYAISLYNILGQKIIEQQTTASSSYYTMPMDISMLPSGMYFIRVVSGNGEWAQRITKQ